MAVVFTFFNKYQRDKKYLCWCVVAFFIKVSCSRGHALVLVLSGECWRYCMKSGSWRRLDHFTMAERELEHKEDTGTDPIVMICCGSTFDVALSESGETLYATLQEYIKKGSTS
jgi:hypothetical protein